MSTGGKVVMAMVLVAGAIGLSKNAPGTAGILMAGGNAGNNTLGTLSGAGQPVQSGTINAKTGVATIG